MRFLLSPEITVAPRQAGYVGFIQGRRVEERDLHRAGGQAALESPDTSSPQGSVHGVSGQLVEGGGT